MKHPQNDNITVYQTSFKTFAETIAVITTLASIALCAAMTASAAPAVTPVDWSSETSGSIGGTGITLSSISIPFPGLVTNFDASGSDFAAAPLPLHTEFVQYGAESSWTATFSQPVDGLLLYVGWWRGNYATFPIDPPTPYTFNRPFTILSGLERVVQNGNTLTFPDDSPIGDPPGFHSGMIQFSGSISSVSVQNSLGYLGGQMLTFAVPVPEPSTFTLLMFAGVLIAFTRSCGKLRRDRSGGRLEVCRAARKLNRRSCFGSKIKFLAGVAMVLPALG